MEEHAASRMAARIAGAAGAVFAIIGLVLVFGAHPSGSRLSGIGSAFQTVIGGVLLVAAALIGVASVGLWLLALRRGHLQRRRTHHMLR
jgi:hypothetical protein